MSLSMSEVSLDFLEQELRQLLVFLDRAHEHLVSGGESEASYVEARLAPDMLPFSAQIQIATDMAKGCGARLAGVEIPKYDDDESTLADLKARIERTLAFLAGLDRAAIDASADRDVTLTIRKQSWMISGRHYLLSFVIPNVMFHVTTTYALLRHKGVRLGKLDFLGPYDRFARPAE